MDAWLPPAAPEPVEAEPELDVWLWADEPAPPLDDDPDVLVVVEAVFPELPADEPDGLVAVAPVFVWVLADEPLPAVVVAPVLV